MKPINKNNKVSFKPNKGIQQRQKLFLPQGAIIHYGGYPFELSSGTFVYGKNENLKLAKENIEYFKPKEPNHGER